MCLTKLGHYMWSAFSTWPILLLYSFYKKNSFVELQYKQRSFVTTLHYFISWQIDICDKSQIFSRSWQNLTKSSRSAIFVRFLTFSLDVSNDSTNLHFVLKYTKLKEHQEMIERNLNGRLHTVLLTLTQNQRRGILRSLCRPPPFLINWFH